MQAKQVNSEGNGVAITRYVARALGTLLLVIMVAFFLAEVVDATVTGGDSLTELTVQGMVVLSLHAVTVLGLALAWRWEGWGALLILAPFAVRYALAIAAGDGIPVIGSFIPFILVGVLYLSVWWSDRNREH